ncbi:metal-dependent hydrolase family protein [Brachybacterium sp. GU-2]|uniref:metal-dependent hydrolase family protein n=1 Tax=Brachybacterium sp. GU-2 TaxID=3069708 RepID=UPI00280B5F0D|nr:amidohydrolase family protein [Brachybacterium sp. GU-2]WME24436.1 amidohydrolase family protein [Brachybacterium sp. GU-2]
MIPLPTGAVLTNTRFLDIETGEWRSADLEIRDGRFAKIAAAGSLADADDAIDLAGKHVLPGLIDCHVHVYAMTANLSELETTAPSYATMHAARLMGDMLDRGFTTVRDTGGADHGLAAAQTEGLLRGPRLFFGGKSLTQTGGHGDTRRPGQQISHSSSCCAGLGVIADGPDAVRRAAREQLRTGAHHLKIMAGGGVASPTDRVDSIQYSFAEMRAAVEEAQDANRYVAAHAYTPGAIQRALDAGVRSIEHANLLDEKSADAIAEAGAFVTMNLVTYWALDTFGAEMGLPPVSQAKVADVLSAGEQALALAHQKGLNLCFGSDLLGGMQVHQSKEFEIRARHQEPLDVIRSATTTAARLLERVGELGVIREGAFADLVVLEADPLQDITVLSAPDPALVIQGGEIVRARPTH